MILPNGIPWQFLVEFRKPEKAISIWKMSIPRFQGSDEKLVIYWAIWKVLFAVKLSQNVFLTNGSKASWVDALIIHISTLPTTFHENIFGKIMKVWVGDFDFDSCLLRNVDDVFMLMTLRMMKSIEWVDGKHDRCRLIYNIYLHN